MTNSDLVVYKGELDEYQDFIFWYNSGYSEMQLKGMIIKHSFYDDYSEVVNYGRIALCIILSRLDIPDHCK